MNKPVDVSAKRDWGHLIGATAGAPAPDLLDEFDPRTGDVSFRISRGGEAEINAAVEAAKAALDGWRCLRPIERGRIMTRCAAITRENRDYLAALDQRETGRRIANTLTDIEVAAQYFEFYGGLVNAAAGRVIDLGDGYHSYIRHEPFGVVGLITPWNSPTTQAIRGAGPAMAVGNTVVLKPSEFTSVATLELVRLCVEQGGLPPGVLIVVTGLGAEAGAALTRHADVRKIGFTGSVRAGIEVGKIAAERIVPVGLELGGKSANIVFADADFDSAVDGAITAFTANTGQICAAGTRLFVERSIHDAFVAAIRARIDDIRIGGAEDDQLAPIITRAQWEKIASYHEVARQEGVEMHVGGKMPENSKGWFTPPVVMTGVTNQMRVAREEIFGPVVGVIPFDGEDEVVAMANDSEYGLVAGLWTRDVSRAHRVAAQLEAGQVFVNDYYAGGVETPFGGYKKSGIGREKGFEAMLHYCQVKTVTVKL